LYINDPLFQKCRQLGITDNYEYPKVEEDGQHRILRERRIKSKINKRSKLLDQCHLNVPQPVPWTDNDHFNKAMDKFRSFEIQQMCYNFFTCTVCLETRLNKCMSNYSEGISKRCKADKIPVKMFSSENKQQFIARKSPCMHVCMLKHGGIASTGHCVTFPQQLNEPVKIFPRLPHEIDIIKGTRQGNQNTGKDFKESRKLEMCHGCPR